MDFFEILKQRRSVRKYIDQPVEPEILEQVMTAAQSAPSWKNGQCWKFVVVTDPEIKKQVIGFTGVFNQSWLRTEYTIILACGNPDESGYRNGQHYYLVDVAIALQNLALAATALGLGTCWIGAFEEDKLKSLLRIPDAYRIVAITPLGYPAKSEGLVGNIAKTVVRRDTRKPLSDIFSYNGWESQ
ncbi:MAG: nitroreductase family protein [Candidatus Zhuqueibacterota bacterium]